VGKSEGRRRMRRSRMRWLEDVEMDLPEIKVKDDDRMQWTEKNGHL
jgi:hypothetical protein